MLDKSARESLQTFAAGKGDVLLAYENEAITAQQKGEELDYVTPGRDDPDREPGRGRRPSRSRAPRRRTRSSTSCASDEAQKIFASKGYRSVKPALVDEKRYPKPASAVRDRQLRRLVEGQRRVLRAAEREDRRDLPARRGRALPPASDAARSAAPAHAGRRPAGGGARPRRGRRLPERDRADPARGRGGAVDRGRLGRLLGGGVQPAGRGGAAAHAGRLARGGARSTRWSAR